MIPLSIPCIEGNEWKYIKECLDTNWISSVGSYVNRFEKELAEYTGSSYAVSCVNGTSALHISLLLSGVKTNDLVILPNITFVASANSIAYAGAEPLLIDIDPNTWQMDLNLLESFLKENTEIKAGSCFLKSNGKKIAAIMPVHVLGNMCDMNRLMQIAKNFHLPIVEDSTEALGSSFQKKHAGTFGTFGCFSFNGNKIISTGGGGMIVTNNEALAKKAKHLTTQAKADPAEYFHDEIGYNYRMVNILAAMGVAQLEVLPTFLERKSRIVQAYKTGLNQVGDISFQHIEESVSPNNWLFTIRTKKQKTLLAHLKANQIEARPFWVPMNKLPMFSQCIYIQNQNHSEEIYNECISLPCSSGIKDSEIQIVIDKIKEI